MADYTTDSPATLVCATRYAPVLGTVTNVRQENGITFLDVFYVSQTAETCSTVLRIAELATTAEIEADIDAFGREWYLTLRRQVADAGTWFPGLAALIGSNYAPFFPPSE